MNGIWIRTQDKECLKLVRSIGIKKMQYGNMNRYEIFDRDDKKDLGEYETKERALEVLDEIQEHIETRVVSDWLMVDMFKLPFDNYTHEEYKEKLKKLSCVYEMPKE